VIDAMWDNKEKRREEPFLSLRLMHAEEAHLLLALEDDEWMSLLAFASAVLSVRNPESKVAGCSKSPSSKAAASEGPRRTLWGTLRV
jgi:hypothetical protein